MRNAIASLLTSFSLVAMALLTGANPALANLPPSNCMNMSNLINSVACEIDIDDNSVLNGNDLKIIILNCLASNNELAGLAQALDDLDISNPPTAEDMANIEAVVREHLSCGGYAVVVIPCGCSQ